MFRKGKTGELRMKKMKTVQTKKLSEKVLALLLVFLCMASLLVSGRTAANAIDEDNQ